MSQLARIAIERGLRHSSRLTERDQALVAALYDVFNGDFEAGEERYRELLGRYPGDMEATFLLAQTLYYSNAYRGRSMMEAEPLVSQVASADPEFLCPI